MANRRNKGNREEKKYFSDEQLNIIISEEYENNPEYFVTKTEEPESAYNFEAIKRKTTGRVIEPMKKWL